MAASIDSPLPAHGPWIDVHAHPGRWFLADLPPDDPQVRALGAASEPVLAEVTGAGMAAVCSATVSDLRVIGPTPEGGLAALRAFAGGEAYRDHRRQLAALRRLTAAHATTIVRGAADVLAAHRGGTCAVLAACEGADFVEGDLERVAEAHAAGVRSIGLVHYRRNDIGDLQTEAPVHGGLTAAGRALVREMNRLGMIVDLAHATYETTLGALEVSDAPLMISHTHLAGDGHGHPRLVAREHAVAVARAGGLIGAWPAGVSSRSLGDFVDEIARLVDAVGIGHVGIGTDMDANYRPVLTAYDQFAALETGLAARGFARDEIDRVLGGNALELIAAVCG